jgi:hypothetical protein
MTEAATAYSEAESEDTDDLAGFLESYAPPAEDAPRDVVEGRFRVLLNQPLPELSRNLAHAFVAEDLEKREENLYALVCTHTMPYRMKGVEALRNTNHPAMLKCYAAATTPLSTPAETRMVMIVERPQGQRLSDLIRETGALPDRFIIEKILKPLNDALHSISKFKINHGCINPDTLYFGKELKIAEPISEPSGFSQDFHYDPPERLLATPSGKGSGHIAADTYAIGVLTLFLSTGGMLPIQQLSEEKFKEVILRSGSYHAFTHNIDPSEAMADLLRGCLNDNPRDRWTPEQLGAWLGGKRFNLILPSVPRDCTRPFQFNEADYFNYRALGHAIFSNNQIAKTHLSAIKLVKWMDLNTNKEEAADRMARVLRADTDSVEEEPPLTDDEIMRAIAILDPFGPMRYRNVSVNIDGLGKALANAFREKDTVTRQHIVTIMESGLPAFISELFDRSSNSLASNILWKLQNLRPILQLKGLGFGVERLLYSLNPSLTCQSPLLITHHPVTIADALNTLDKLAKTHANRHSLIDTHLASFLANKLDITKEIRVLELAGHQDLFLDQRLIILKLLAMAQQKTGNPPLKGLAVWMSQMISPIVDKLHQKSSRELLRKELAKATKTGILENIAFVLFNEKIFNEDRQGYQRATILYKFHNDAASKFKDTTKMRQKAMQRGRDMSVTIGYIVLAFGIYNALNPFIRL